ncbi:MAG: malto-oligosyltrehalose trehalohydrolase [Bacteroidetes bacterium SW_9_63_38]|nr:MAG: malto-oligosyltrehalose trehalohydrolase [Bacteroidetes bacterium SW_9_63_38]
MDLSSPSPWHGALVDGDTTAFRVWAPDADQLGLVLDPNDAPHPMNDVGNGYFELTDVPVGSGTRYKISLDDTGPFPDPASRFQPKGVHGPSEVVAPTAYPWSDDNWTGIDRAGLVFYELHVGTFTGPGTFKAVQERLSYLQTLGVTALQLMPVHDFPGRWNWGYDPAALFAPSRAYGSPDALRRLVDAAHQAGLAVFLDVIYNHLGPDGAYTNAFAPFLTDKYGTPWGPAINLDDEGSEGVRRFFIDNALHWLREYHLDGLRLDATHALHDESDPHFLAELSTAVDEHVDGFRRHLIAEDHRNLNRLVQPQDADGYGLDGVWSDDLHHQCRVFTAGDEDGYYRDFQDTTAEDIATTLNDGWFFRGEYSAYLDEERGTDPGPVDRDQCVVFIQNHDQVGNRALGDRLTDSVALPTYRALSTLLCVTEELPLLFMGQEWAAASPFQFFTDHNDEIGPTVSEGRKEEFSGFSDFAGDFPDPQDPASFQRSVLDWDEPRRPPHDGILALYRDLLALRPEVTNAQRDTGEGLTAAAPTDSTLRIDRPPYRAVLNLAGTADMALPPKAPVLLHTEQGGYTSDPNPPGFTDDAVSFVRPGAVIVRTD